MCDNPSMNGFCEYEPEIEQETKLRMLYTDEPKANYICGIDKVIDEYEVEKVEITDISKYDYQIGDPKPEDDTLIAPEQDKRKTISFMSVNSIEDGIEWYKTQYPAIPDDLYPIMARWNWGDLSTLTKKDIKNDTKRIKKGQKPKNMCLEKKVGKFVVDFN